MKLGKAVDIYLAGDGRWASVNPLRNNTLFNRLMNDPRIQSVLFKHEINFRKKESGKPVAMSGEYLSMKDKDTSIILADTQVLEKCISILRDMEEEGPRRYDKRFKEAKKTVIDLLETEIRDIDELEKELESENEISEIQVNQIIVEN